MSRCRVVDELTCDHRHISARNCILAIQKRLQHRNANVQLYALTVRAKSHINFCPTDVVPKLSDALVNNCKIDLHREISSRAFTQTLTRMVQDRVGLKQQPYTKGF